MAKRVDPKLIDGQWWIDGPEGRAVWDEAADEWRYAPRPPGRQRHPSFVRRLAPYVAASVLTLCVVAGFLWADRTTLHWVTGSNTVRQVQPAQVTAPLPAQAAAPLPDRVVAVLLECEVTKPVSNSLFPAFATPTTYLSVAEIGAGCSGGFGEQVSDLHLHLTIRRDDGAIYTADVLPGNPTIAVGDTWPR